MFARELVSPMSVPLVEALVRRRDPRDARWALVVMLDGTGIGKTSALSWVEARHFRDARNLFARDAAVALTDRLRSFAQERADPEFAESLREVDLLAQDELGTETPRDSAELLHLVSL